MQCKWAGRINDDTMHNRTAKFTTVIKNYNPKIGDKWIFGRPKLTGKKN
jgi:hypothetical protein